MVKSLRISIIFLYLCNAFGDALRVKAAAQHSSSELGSAFALALHLPCKSEVTSTALAGHEHGAEGPSARSGRGASR